VSHELVKASPVSVPAIITPAALPVLVERAGGAARFAWDEFFFAEHHNEHTQKAYMAAVRRFLSWCEGQGVELPSIAPGQVGQYLTGLGGSTAKRNLHLSALRGFFDRMVNRHVCILNPAASVKGVKEQVIEGKTPEITLEQARTLIGSIKLTRKVKARGKEPEEVVNVVGLRDRAILASLAYTVAGPGRSQGCGFRTSSMTGRSTCCGFRRRGARAEKSRCGTTWKGISGRISTRRASWARIRIGPCSARR
jgi:integrase/recombinase XerD